MWNLLFVVLVTLWIARRLSMREWIGSGPWKWWWFVAPIVLLAVAHSMNNAWINTRPADYATLDWTAELVTGAKSIGGVPLAVFLICVAVPLIEEFVFRACLLGGLTRHISFGWANIVQAVIFVALHQNSRAFAFLVTFALVQGWMTRKTRGLGIPILTHAGVNEMYVWAFYA
ncbi:lysostaphin resistance A-like protein [Paraburkholderia sp. BR10882]|uniref:CPBP family intramembrane glutamic endopeptidase n=1 Tax=unclassified Paraburkholderia TaxID=2615204 RepID=UPI0034CDC37D